MKSVFNNPRVIQWAYPTQNEQSSPKLIPSLKQEAQIHCLHIFYKSLFSACDTQDG